MKIQDSSFNGLKGTKSVTHPRTLQKQYAPSHQLFQSWGHNNILVILNNYMESYV